MAEKYSEAFKIQFSETDFTLKCKLYALINKMQEVSGAHGDILGLGYEALWDHDLGWIISKYRISMKRYPKWGEIISIETWPSGIDRLFAMRSFRIYDEAQNHIGSIYSAYILVNTKTGRPQRISALPVELPVIEDDEQQEKLDKLTMPSEPVTTLNRVVNYSDIDLNMHMNNACYVQWVEDCFSLEQHEKMQIKNIQVNFISGAKIGEEIILNVYEDAELANVNYVSGKDKIKGRNVFQAKVEWENEL